MASWFRRHMSLTKAAEMATSFSKLSALRLRRHRSIHIQVAKSSSLATNPTTQVAPGVVLQDLEDQSLIALEWPQVCNNISTLAKTSTVQERCKRHGIKLSATREECMKILDQCEEARTIFIQDRLYVTEAEAKEEEEEEEEEKSTISYRDEFFLVEGLAHTLLKYIGGVADIQRYFQELARGNSLNGEEFWLIGESLKAVIKVQQALLQVRNDYPLLNRQIQSSNKSYEQVKVVYDEVQRIIEGPGGEIASSASPDLSFIREERQENFQNLSRLVEETLQSIVRRGSTETEKSTTTAFRDGRVCFRVAASAKANLFPNGSVLLDQSATGQSHYVEPKELIELNNSEAQLKGLEEEEKKRILQLLSGVLLKNEDHVQFALECVYELDLILAKAQYSILTGGSRPFFEMSTCSFAKIIGLRHPLLPDPVPLDYEIDPSSRIAVISGPNAGGKTVALKALGLAAIMTRAGIYLPCQDGATISFFSPVVAVMGDDQNLAKGQSTFSSYMTKVHQALEAVGIEWKVESDLTINLKSLGQAEEFDHSPYLLLLDELGSGTDPAEGAALALAILEALNGQLQHRDVKFKSGLAMITSHFDAVREAAADGSLTNCPFAAVTTGHSLKWGQTGQSEALQAARKMNLPEEVIADSMVRLERGPELMKDALLAIESDSNHRFADLKVRQAYSKELRNKLDIALADSARAAEIVKRWGGGNGRKTVEKSLRQIKDKLKTALEDSKSDSETGSKDKLKRAQKQQQVLKSLIKKMRVEFQEIFQPDSIGAIDRPQTQNTEWVPKIGDVVECSKFSGTRGVVEKINDSKLEVSFGSLRTVVEINEVYPSQNNSNLSDTPRRGKRSKAATTSKISSTEEKANIESSTAPTVETAANSVTVIGMRVREAEQEVGRLVSRAKEQGWGAVYIIHGRGEGILRDTIRSYLTQHKLVQRAETVIESLGAKTVAYL